MSDSERGDGKKRLLGQLGQMRHSAKNMLEILQKGHLTKPYRAKFGVTHRAKHYALRRYERRGHDQTRAVVLFVPPLMVTPEIYDISPELSAVGVLLDHNVDVWGVDFGAPEHETEGMQRDLDDHILAVVDAIERAHRETGSLVHLIGYSQGGLFAYQAASYLRGEGVGSIVTMGSPVDMRRSFPIPVHDEISRRLLAVVGDALARPLEQIQGLPGMLTSRGFKVINAGKELRQIAGFFGALHDREALERREPKRRFLGGDGFVAWPGPALKQFVDEVVSNNRMAHGGLVVEGRAVSLTDLRCPILYFVGTRDDLARPAAVRTIRDWATHAPCFEREIAAGHFGLVVGTKAMRFVWPTVLAWLEWSEHAGPEDVFDAGERDREARSPIASRGKRAKLTDSVAGRVDGLLRRVGDVSLELTDAFDALRWQLGRLVQLEDVTTQRDSQMHRVLRDRALELGDESFFLWRGQAFTYAMIEEHVARLSHELEELGVVGRVGVLVTHPVEALVVLVALERAGCAAVLLDPTRDNDALTKQRGVLGARACVADFDTLALADALGFEVVVLHDGDDTCVVSEPADDAALSSEGGDERVAFWGADGGDEMWAMSHQRWAASSLVGAALARVTRRDTLYMRAGSYDPFMLSFACGAALMTGARLVCGQARDAESIWTEVRRHGVTIIAYERELLELLAAAPEHAHGAHPVRGMIGRGCDESMWYRLQQLMPGVNVQEVFWSAGAPALLAHPSDPKPGSLGRVLPTLESAQAILWDDVADAPLLDAEGRALLCRGGKQGMLVIEIEPGHALFDVDMFGAWSERTPRILRSLVEVGDSWFVTGVSVSRDHDGDYWVVSGAESIER